ncbi:MAG TPA: ATP-binding protein [Gemmatimonadaceae bacterium]|nr:ATP-binding protein [Gemmatimonadaceae bacterium]HPV76517.1 ATP-binding protein [Gemmatimonadaceae bacterium]
MSTFFSAAGAQRWTSEWTRRSAGRFGLEGASTLDQWRGRILAALLGGALTLGAPTLVLAIFVLSAQGMWQMVAVDVVAYTLTFWTLFSRTLSYRTRAWMLIVSLLTIGVLTLYLAGFRTAGSVWLSMAALSAGLLLGVRSGVAVVLANVMAFVAIGVGIALGHIGWAVGVDDALRLWALSTVNTAMLGLMATVSVGVLVSGLEREAEARLKAEAERRRGQHLEALGTLAGGIAHDVNNLLTPILANVELLADSSDDESRELLDDIRASAERGRDLVKRLLMLRKGEVAIHETGDLGAVVREVARLVRARADARVRIELRLTALPLVHASSAELHQIVMNLAINSAQAMSSGGVVVIEAERVMRDGLPFVRLRVRDNGDGMSPDTLARVFEPFFTTKAAQEGTGLGLPTVRNLVLALGGSIDIDSARGIGTVVTVMIPASRAEAIEGADGVRRQVPSAPRRPTPTSVTGADARGRVAPRTILLVDDEPVVLETARRVVAALGHQAVAVSSAAAAEAWFAEHADDCALVITDYRMPGRTGTQMIAALRRLREHLPAVVVSGFVAEAARDVRSLGVKTALLSKPYGMADLKSAIDDACPRIAARG